MRLTIDMPDPQERWSLCCTSYCTNDRRSARKHPETLCYNPYRTTTYAKLGRFVIGRSAVQLRSSAPYNPNPSFKRFRQGAKNRRFRSLFFTNRDSPQQSFEHLVNRVLPLTDTSYLTSDREIQVQRDSSGHALNLSCSCKNWWESRHAQLGHNVLRNRADRRGVGFYRYSSCGRGYCEATVCHFSGSVFGFNCHPSRPRRQ